MTRRGSISAMPQDRWSYLWLILAAVCMVFFGGRWPLPLAAWLWGVFLLRFVRTQPLGRGLLLAWVAMAGTAMITWWGLIPLPPIFHFIIIAAGAGVMILPFLADRLLAARLPGFASTLVYPAAYTALDFLYVLASPLPAVNTQAHAVYGNLALLQLVSVTGMWGLTFLVSWLAPVVNWAWERAFAWRQTWRGVAIYGGLVLAVLAYGQARLTFGRPEPGTVRGAAIVSVDLRAKIDEVRPLARTDRARFRQISAEHQEIYFQDTIREAQAGAQLVLWPEMAIPVAKEDEEALIARGQEVAAEQEIYLAMLYYTSYQEERRGENKMAIVDPNGEVVLEHLKFGGAAMEGWLPGDGVLHTVETPWGTLSGVVCGDTNFPMPMSQSGRNGTGILLSPTLEWRAIDPLGTYIAVFRAIENGVTLFRAADNGISVAVDPYGRIIGAVDHFEATERVLVAQLPTHGVRTIYSIIGNVVPWLCVAGMVVLIVWAVVRRRRSARARPT